MTSRAWDISEVNSKFSPTAYKTDFSDPRGGACVYEAAFTIQDKGQGSLSNARASGSSRKNNNVPNVYTHTRSPSFATVLFAPFLISFCSIILQSTFCLYHPETPRLRATCRGHGPCPLNRCVSYCSRAKVSLLVPHRGRLEWA